MLRVVGTSDGINGGDVMIKIRGAKRRGSLIADALVAFVILALLIIPVAAAITFSYYSIASSAEISTHANMFYDRIDNTILENNTPSPAAAFAGWAPAGSAFISKNSDGTGPSINVSLISSSDMFTAGQGKRRVTVDVFMIMQ